MSAKIHLKLIITLMPPRYTRLGAFLALALFVAAGIFVLDRWPQQTPDFHHFPSLQKLGHDVQSLSKENPLLTSQELDPCTVISPQKGFIDLRGLSVILNHHGQEVKHLVWSSKGYDSGHNYTVGICQGAIKNNLLPSAQVADGLNALEVGAYYVDQKSGKYILMGQVSSRPVFKGKKLTLTYENGTTCNGMYFKDGLPLRRKTIMTFTCDREMLTRAHVSYVASVDECTYIFEVRSHLACPTAAKKDNLAAVFIFVLIVAAALLVYFSGGFLYKALKQRQAQHHEA